MDNCLICGEKNRFSKKIKVKGYLYAFCAKCEGGTLFSRKKAIRKLAEVYQPGYFNWEKVSGLKRFVYNIKLHETYPDWIERFCKRGRILDVGAGIPDFVVSMKERGWIVQAQELSFGQAKKLSTFLGKKNVIAGDFEKVKLKNDLYDVVTFWHVLEHVKFPRKTILKAKKILKKGGIIFLEVPNSNSLTWKVFGNSYSLLSVPAHLFYFSDKSLKMLLNKYGFNVLEIKYPIKYSSAFIWSLMNFIRVKTGLKNKKVENLIFLILLPLSLMLNIILKFFGRSEIIRIVARKSF